MGLAEFIRSNHEKIIVQWIAFARTMLPWAEGMSESELKDHAEELLTAVVKDMESPQSSSQRLKKSEGRMLVGVLKKIGRMHASDRIESGFSLNQLVAEFRSLRASVLRLWEEAQGEKQGEVSRFNEAIDEILSESTTQFAETMQSTKEHFLGVLSHDLRTPLSAVSMGASFLAKSEHVETREVAARILSSAERMHRLVNDLLDLTRSRLGAGIPVVRTAANLEPVCRQVIAELQAGHPGRRIRFESGKELNGEWDCDRLAQVLSNLVANALQYGASKTPVSIVAGENASEITLKVHNEGPPVPQHLLATIFVPMLRHDPDGTDSENPTGLGLGLYIASEIVSSHDGTIGVSSSAEEGTTFIVTLPRVAKSIQTSAG